MIISSKNIKLSNSFLGAGSILLEELETKQTVSSLWEKVREREEIKVYEKFILILDFLFSLNLIHYDNGMLKKYD